MFTVRQILAERAFLRVWIAQATSVLGDFVALFAVQMAVTFRLHGAPADITRVMLAFLIPAALLGPVAGVFVDRCHLSPFRIMAACDIARGLLIPLLALAGLREICFVCAAIATASSFFHPAQSAAMPTLVKREGLLAANGLMLQTMQVARVCAPPLASVLAGWGGERACYWADSLSFFVSAALLWTLPCGLRNDAEPQAGHPAQGVKFILANRRYCFVMLSDDRRSVRGNLLRGRRFRCMSAMFCVRRSAPARLSLVDNGRGHHRMRRSCQESRS